MSDNPDDFPLKNSPASILRRMADLLDKNPDSAFGGCAVVIPPQGGLPIEVLILDPSTNLPQFWSAIKGRIELTLAELDNANRQTWGR